MKAGIRHKFVYSVSAMALAAWGTAAYGQDAGTSGNERINDALHEIVVTAQKRSENVQSVPIAVTALDAQALSQATVKDLRDLSGRVPGLVVDSVTSAPSTASIALRGISFDDVEKSFDPAVGVAIDGVFIGTNTGQLLDSFDMERMEVLRGPQGTLFGRNTIGGVISVTRTRPTETAGVKAQFSYSSYNSKSARLVLNSGTINDLIALKAFGSWDKTDGFVNNLVQNRKDGRYETLHGGLTALITPGSDLTATLTYEHIRERGESVSIPLSNGTDLFCAYAGYPGFSPTAECDRFTATSDRGAYATYETAPRGIANDTDMVTGNIEWDIAGGVKLFSVTGYQRNHEDAYADFDGSEVDFFNTRREQRYHQFSQELRVVADLTDRINLLAGVYYFNSGYKLYQSTFLGAGLGGPAVIGQYTDHHAESYAGFLDAQFKLTDRFKVTLGGRQTRDKKRLFTNYGLVSALVQITDPTYTGTQCENVVGTFDAGGGLILPVYAPGNDCSGRADFSKFTWRANAEYSFAPGKMVYAAYSKGFRSGGLNARATGPTSIGPYAPEVVDAYEVGLKADWLRHTLRANIALYYSKYHNKQEEVVQPSPPGAANPQETVVKNAASATIKGIEIETVMQLGSYLSANTSFAYTDAKYDKFFNDVVGATPGSPPDNVPDDVSTMDLRRAPRYQWSFGLNYTHPLGNGHFDASALLRYSSKYATCIVPGYPITPGQIRNDSRCFTKDRENLSAQIGYTFDLGGDKELNIAVFGRNLTDTRDVMGVLPVAGLFTFGTPYTPRVIGAQIGFKY
ncbi:TonB-dependent receptor [Sphingobium sp. Sx8-8]|uniref:TonB-dependent receptor n=1 Tax=Sphingobium sp. Sx8-8 TaxID=2933617 RepID=UPI001F5927C3|nr:TonB-dependent receptor [Sphingobium sp. Sx8-8]